MTKTGTFAWILAATLAVASHAVGVAAVATLLREGPLPLRNELKFGQAGLLKPSENVEATVSAEPALPVISDQTSAPSAGDNPELTSQSDARVLTESNDTPQLTDRMPNDALVATVTENEAPQPASSSRLQEAVTPGSGQLNAGPAISLLDTAQGADTVVMPERTSSSGAITPSSNSPVLAAAPEGAHDEVLAEDGTTVPAAQSGAVQETVTDRADSDMPLGDGATTAGTPVIADAKSGGSAAALQPIAPTGSGEFVVTTAESTVLTEAPSAENAEAPATQLALVVPRQDLPVETPNSKPLASGVISVEEAVRGYAGGACFLAIPRQDSTGSWTVTSYGVESGQLDAFDRHMKAAITAPLVLAKRSLQQAQCLAVDFAGTFARTSASGFALSLDQSRLNDGDRLSGLISGFTKQWVYVLLVDDDGMAQDVSKFADSSGSQLRIGFPVHVKGDGKARAQLLFTIASDRPLAMLTFPAPQPLASLLPLVRGEIAAAKAKVEVIVTDFEVY